MIKITMCIINFYLIKKKLNDKENILITLSSNFLKPFKNGLLNIPQLNI